MGIEQLCLTEEAEMLNPNKDVAQSSRVVREVCLEVDEWFLEVSVEDDDPEPPPGARCPQPKRETY